MATAIAFEHISKQYRLGLVSTKTLSHDLRRFWITNVLGKEDPYLKIGEVNDRSTKGQSDYVWALRDIDFKVEQGDVLGIIGKNGAGKSTLLKLLSKVTGPTTGTIRAHGRIGSLLEVGTGFHPEMTGRENIFLNGAILGMTRHEIQRKLDEIIDFSGCERYIDTPVKRYSSGMMVRLGFAVAAFLEPEILVVDEVLAVGDAEFQKKAIGKMQDVSKGEGRTVLFVSHNMGSVRNLCRSGIVLDKGMIAYSGTANDCISFYMDNRQNEMCKTYERQEQIETVVKPAYFEKIELENDSVTTVSPIRLYITIRANKDIPNARVNCTIRGLEDMPIGTVSSNQTFELKKGEKRLIEYEIPNHNLSKGKYFISFSVGSGDYSTGQTDYEVVEDAVGFRIEQYSKEDKDSYVQWVRNWGTSFFQHRVKVIE